jgi:hypothetical protein
MPDRVIIRASSERVVLRPLGGGSRPGGIAGMVQFNATGVFGGSENLTFDGTTLAATAIGAGALQVDGDGSIDGTVNVGAVKSVSTVRTGLTNVATSATPVQLGVFSSQQQRFTGSANQEVRVAPFADVQVVGVGWTFRLCNESTGTVTVRDSNGISTITTVPPGGECWLTAVGGVTWEFQHIPGTYTAGQIIFGNGGDALRSIAGLSVNPTTGDFSVGAGHTLIGGALPTRHTQAAGYKGVWPGGSTSNACIMGETSAPFAGLMLFANVARDSTLSWVCADTANPAWKLGLQYGGSTDLFCVGRAAATTGALAANWRWVIKTDKNLRSVFQTEVAADPAVLTGFTAKLAISNVGAIGTDHVLLLRGNASQTGNYLTAQTSGGTAVAQLKPGGSLSLDTAGAGLQLREGSNAKMGTVALVAGSAVVANTSVTATSRIFLTSQADGGAPGWLRVSARTAGTSFTITSSSATDTSTVAYMIVDPA